MDADVLVIGSGQAGVPLATRLAATGKKVILNTGARPVVPSLEGLDRVPWLHNGTLLELRELPDHLVVMGGGYIGCEFAQMFRRFGARVTVVDRGPHLLAREDPEISEVLE